MVPNPNIHHKTVNRVPIYVNLTRKTLFNLSLLLLLLLLPLIFTSFCIPYKITAAVSQHIQTPLSTVALINLGNILVVSLVMFVADCYHAARKEIQIWMKKMNFQSSYKHIALCDEISSCTISLWGERWRTG